MLLYSPVDPAARAVRVGVYVFIDDYTAPRVHNFSLSGSTGPSNFLHTPRYYYEYRGAVAMKGRRGQQRIFAVSVRFRTFHNPHFSNARKVWICCEKKKKLRSSTRKTFIVVTRVLCTTRGGNDGVRKTIFIGRARHHVLSENPRAAVFFFFFFQSRAVVSKNAKKRLKSIPRFLSLHFLLKLII